MTGEPRASFYRMIDQARLPKRGDRSADGVLPTRATRYCEAVTSASAFGWWLYPPMDLWLLWDGSDVYWCYAEQPEWMQLESAQFPNFANRFDLAAPDFAQGCAPPFLTVLPEPGALQIWTGLFARTEPEWSLLVRSPANLPHPGGYIVYEGIIETDHWFGPLFANIRLTRTNAPIHLRAEHPIIQAQPLPRDAYADDTLNSVAIVAGLDDWQARDWADYDKDIVQPNSVSKHVPGRYASAVRRRRKSGCPFGHAEAG